MSRSRRNHTAAFKAKVAIAAIKGDQPSLSLRSALTFIPTRSRNGNHSCSRERPKRLARAKNKAPPDVKELHAKIGQLALENDFLERALGRIDGSSAKR